MPKLNEAYKNNRFQKLHAYEDDDELHRLQEYFEHKPYATTAELHKAGFGELLAIAKHPAVLREYCGVPPQEAKIKTKKINRTLKCKPFSRRTKPIPKEEPDNSDDRNIQLPSYETPASNTYEEPIKQRRGTYTAEDLETIMSEMRNGTDLSAIAEKVRKKEGGLIQKMRLLSKQNPNEFDPKIIKRYIKVYKHEQYEAVVRNIPTTFSRDNSETAENPKNAYVSSQNHSQRKKPKTFKEQMEAQMERTKARQKAFAAIPKVVRSYDHVPPELMQNVREIVVKHLSVSTKNINPNTNLAYDLNANTLDKAELYFDMEDRFKIEIREDEEDFFTHKLETIGSLAEYIMQTQRTKNRKPSEELEKEDISKNRCTTAH